MNVRDILPEEKEDQQAFILDHGKQEDGVLKYQDNVTSYGWNIKMFNKMRPGAYVLNRHPGKITKDRKFEIYGGGYVESISEPDGAGNVVAKITHPFKFVAPLKQGERAIEEMEWDNKKRKPNSWEHFWNQYGMNTITCNDFWRLVEGMDCIPIDGTREFKLAAEGDDNIVEELIPGDFKVTIEDDPTHSGKKKARKFTARHVDYEKVKEAQNKVGALGEEIVMDLLKREAKEKGCKQPVHVSKEEGDGLGYDIRCWDESETEIHVEVKTTTTGYSDGFQASMNEVEASKNKDCTYKIYRVYNLNSKTLECSLKIYDGPIDNNQFKLVPTTVVVYQK